MAATRRLSAASNSEVYLSCEGSSPSCRVALLPKMPLSVSMMDTSCTRMPGTAELTNLAMAAIWGPSNMRPGCKVSTTEALGRSCSRTNAEGLGTAK